MKIYKDDKEMHVPEFAIGEWRNKDGHLIVTFKNDGVYMNVETLTMTNPTTTQKYLEFPNHVPPGTIYKPNGLFFKDGIADVARIISHEEVEFNEPDGIFRYKIELGVNFSLFKKTYHGNAKLGSGIRYELIIKAANTVEATAAPTAVLNSKPVHRN